MDRKIGKDVKISKKATIDVSEYLEIGDRSVINDHAKIEGRRVVIGREAWIHEYSWIGGGSCFEETAELTAGDFLHLGRMAHINTAAGVKVGDEVGIGHMSNIWTHGAYPPMDLGFPTQFAPVVLRDRVWLPHAWVNPGVTIGCNTVVAAMSLVNCNLPSRCFAGGIPAKVLRTYAYPNEVEFEPMRLFQYLKLFFKSELIYDYDSGVIRSKTTKFDLPARRIIGPANSKTERLKNLLRRCGIRFRYCKEKGEYVEWK